MKTIWRSLPLLLLAAGVWAGAAMGQADGDGDGIANDKDQCPYTAAGAAVDARGCSLDGDEDVDGIADASDECPYSPPKAVVDAKGCALDADFDGIPDGLDRCNGTELGARVNLEGCAEGQSPASPSTLVEAPAPAPAAEATVEAAPAVAETPATEPAPAEEPAPATVASEPAPPAAAPAASAAPAVVAADPAAPKDVAPAVRKVSEAQACVCDPAGDATAIVASATGVQPVVTVVEIPMLRPGVNPARRTDATEVAVRQVAGEGLAPVTIIELPKRIGSAAPAPRLRAEPEQVAPVSEPATPISEPATPISKPVRAMAPAVIAAPTAAPSGGHRPAYVYNRQVVVAPTGPRDQLARHGLQEGLVTASTATAGLAESAVAFGRLLKRIHFATRSHQITQYSQNLLNELAEQLRNLLARNPAAKLELVGYADPGSEQAGAKMLAADRAEAVRRYLIGLGLDGTRLHTRAAGAVEPLKSSGDPDAGRLNPRVEIRSAQ